MNKFKAGDRVRVNAPDAVGIHGKIGTVRYQTTTGVPEVVVDVLRSGPSYLFPEELLILNPPPTV